MNKILVQVESVDDIISESLKDSVGFMQSEIVRQLLLHGEVLGSEEKDLKALIRVHNYYTVPTKHIRYKNVKSEIKREVNG